MRYLFVLFSLIPTFCSLAQDPNSVKKFPFQILYAENTKNKTGQVLKSLDIVSIDDILTIGENGILSLIHYTGFPIEVNGDTTIKISDLQDLIGVPDNDKSTLSFRPKIDYLFVSNSHLAKKNKLGDTGTCHDCNYDLEIIYPPTFRKPLLNYQDGLCLKWIGSTSKKYQVNITDVYDDSLRSYITDKNVLTVIDDELRALQGKEKALLVQIYDLENNKFSGRYMLKEFPTNNLKFPYNCSPEKATFALIAGFYTEMLPQNYFDEAEKYFLLATELSDKPFYKEMLANFRKRTER